MAWAGLTGVGVLHLAWASGSTWPERNRKRLGAAVIGSGRGLPAAATTATVGGLAIAGGAIVGGALGERGLAVCARRGVAAMLLTRAVIGGDGALQLLGRAPGGKRFAELDRTIYRPLCAVLGLAALLGARRRAPRS